MRNYSFIELNQAMQGTMYILFQFPGAYEA